MVDAPNEVRFVIPGEPCSQGRHRDTVINGHVHRYTPSKTKNFQNKVALFAVAAGVRLREGPIVLDIEAFWPSKNPPRKRVPRPQEPRDKSPDWDNIGKLISDALQGIAYPNDSRIFDARVRTWNAAQGEAPRTEVRICSPS